MYSYGVLVWEFYHTTVPYSDHHQLDQALITIIIIMMMMMIIIIILSSTMMMIIIIIITRTEQRTRKG